MGMPIASSPREASSTSGQRLLDEARLMPIHVIAALACLGGAALDGYILGIVGPALALAKNELLLTATSQGLIACSALIGVFIGGLVFGNFADRYGRRPVFSWNLAAFIVLSVCQFFVQDIWQLVVIRLLLGLAIGVEYAVGWSAWLDITPEGVSKAAALEGVRRRLGVEPGATVAVGDQRNDLEMLRWAARGVAMDNAPDEVKAAADEVTGHVDDDGLVAVLRSLT